MYQKFWKRFLDVLIAFSALMVLSPVLLLLAIVGAIAMKGDPFFTQERPGKNDRIFKLVKFRSMSNARDAQGKLLPDHVRLGKYGRFLRATSLDELPELWNILKGDMSLVGPRPLLVAYLERYSPEQRRRHEVSPGLTGYAQAYGRNTLTWEEKFQKDVYYVDHISFVLDVKILLKTVTAVLKHEGVSSETSATMEEFMGTPQQEESHA